MRVGIIDDDLEYGRLLREKIDYEAVVTDDPGEVLRWVGADRIDCLLSDLRMPEVGGLELMKRVKKVNVTLPVVLLTGHGSISTAVKAMKEGARDYLEKPVDEEELNALLKRVEEEIKKENQLEAYRASSDEQLEKLVGSSAVMEDLREKIQQVAPEDINVLIHGETGTGKELVARSIHSLGDRSEAPLMTINCAAIPRDLLEEELFGHVEGAFTGAGETRKGKVELADGGTVFLDEISELPLELQPKLLRVIERGEVTKIGGDYPRTVDVRFLAATNRKPGELLRAGEFREDLYYRLNTMEIETPPLREHPGDIPGIAEYFLDIIAAKKGDDYSLAEETLEAMKKYEWPGNVRELKNVVERLVVLAGPGKIDKEDLPAEVLERASGESPLTGEQWWFEFGDELPEILGNIEEIIIEQALEEAEGNRSAAARKLGISRQSLQYKLDSD